MSVERIKSILVASAEPDDFQGKLPGSLPLHVTILPAFTHERHSTDPLGQILRARIRNFAPIETIGEDEEYFGTEEQIEERAMRVRRLGGNGLQQLHRAVLPDVLSLPGVRMDVHYAGSEYHPHVTYDGDRGLERGEPLYINHVYLCQSAVRRRFWSLKHTYSLEGRAHDQTAS